MSRVTIVSVEDWEALYIDGKKVDEGHSLRLSDVLKALGIYAEFRDLEADLEPDAPDGEFDFADNLEDVKYVPYPDIEEDE